MKNLVFDWDGMVNGNKAVMQASKPFNRAGANVVEASVDPGVKRTSGISYREMLLTFADSQTVTLQIKQSGDIYAVKINGKPFPIKNQDDHGKAIAEIVDAMTKGRAAFQKKMAVTKTELPKEVKSAAPKLKETLSAQHADIDTQIAEKTAKRDELKQKLGTMLDSVDDEESDDAKEAGEAPDDESKEKKDEALDDVKLKLNEGVTDSDKKPETKTESGVSFDDLTDGERRILKCTANMNGRCPRDSMIADVFGNSQGAYSRGMDAVSGLIRKKLAKIISGTIPAKAIVQLTDEAMKMSKENAFILDALSDCEDKDPLAVVA